jgi:hypothetical protein
MTRKKKVVVTRQARQGDVLIVAIDNVPSTMSEKVKDPRGVVLAEGEATGHHHRIRDPGVCLLRAEGVAYDLLRIQEGVVSLVHEEHSTIHVGPCTFEVRIQREHSWNAEAEEASRAVAD